MKNLTISLHQDLIVEILLRLPVSSLLRFKCVCKSWHSLICDSQFAKSHFDLAAAPSNRVLISKINDAFVVSNDLSDESTVALRLPAHPLIFDTTVEFWGSCRGFVLLQYFYSIGGSYRSDLIVWNPSTGEHKLVPHASDMGYKYMYGFGYDALTDDYLIICINCKRENEYGDEYINKTQFVLYSVKTNSWNYLQYLYEGGKFYSLERGLLLNGVLHWLPSFSSVAVIVAFDLGQRSLSEIPLPSDSAHHHTCNFELYTIGGCLGVWCRSWERCELWVMKEYNVLSSWTLLFASPLRFNDGWLFESNLFRPRPEGITGKIFECCLSLEQQHQGKIYGRNYCCRGIEMSITEGLINQPGLCEHLASGEGLVLYKESLWPAMYRESLLSLPCDNGETSQDHQP